MRTMSDYVYAVIHGSDFYSEIVYNSPYIETEQVYEIWDYIENEKLTSYELDEYLTNIVHHKITKKYHDDMHESISPF